jgi:tetratricopeptide (TPR) repeat protein
MLDPKEPLAYNNRAYCKFKLGDLKGALADVNQSLALYPANSYAYRNRALIYLAQKKMKSVCEDVQEALRLGFSGMYGDEMEKLQQQYCNYKSL